MDNKDYKFIVQAIAPYEARNDTEVSLELGKYYKVVLTESRGKWYQTIINGNRGWFPTSYIKRVEDEDDVIHASALRKRRSFKRDMSQSKSNDEHSPKVTSPRQLSNDYISTGIPKEYEFFDLLERGEKKDLLLVSVGSTSL